VEPVLPTNDWSPAAPAEALRRPGTVLLDAARADPDRPAAEQQRRALLFERPERVLTARRRAEVPGVLAAVDEATAAGRFVAGFVGYEAGYAFEPAVFPERRAAAEPEGPPLLLWLGVYDRPQGLAPAMVEEALAEDASPEPPQVEDARFAITRAAYRDKIAEVKSAIRAGDVYQINFTAPMRFRAEGDPPALYRRMRRRQPVPYGAFLNIGDGRRVLSCSPELFFRRDGRRIWTRPMKGTVRRGDTPPEDERLRRALAADDKSRAENLMIVDLLRNDLSVCCEAGSVRVPELFAVEPYDTVSQMTSTVEGQLRPDAGYADLFRALFPCGSVTGAPKLRAMRHIRRLEDGPRGVYCGAVGFAGPEEAVFNVAIRTVELKGAQGRMGIGSGVVWDSDADDEYEECLLKAQFLDS
jgi:para-aminobenzoate synthetase/4-amino-4-deoxychorismate lyase